MCAHTGLAHTLADYPWGTAMNDAFTWLDLVIVLLLVSFVTRGAWIGLIRQLAAFFALVGSYVIAARYLSLAMPIAQDFVDNPVLVFLISFALLFASVNVFSMFPSLLPDIDLTYFTI